MGVRLDHPNARAKWMRTKREQLRAARLCVNGANHGPAAPGTGGRCQTCADKRNRARRVDPDGD